MAQIEIVPVEGFARFTTFCKLPRLLYRGMRGFAPPLDLERWTLFAHRLNPHYKLVEEQKFLARRHIVKEVLHVDNCAYWRTGPILRGDLPAFDPQLSAKVLTFVARRCASSSTTGGGV